MLGSISQFLNAIPFRQVAEGLRIPFNSIAAGCSTQCLTSAGLVITATSGKKTPKTGASITYGSVLGSLVSIASGTDTAALAGTVTNAKFNVYCFYVDGAGALTSAMGTEGATLAAVKFPPTPDPTTSPKALYGFIIINPTGTGNFVGGTTAIDDATVVPNTVYINVVGDFDPNIQL